MMYGIKVIGARGGTYVLTRRGFIPSRLTTSVHLNNKYRPRQWKTRNGAQRNADKCTTTITPEVFEINDGKVVDHE